MPFKPYQSFYINQAISPSTLDQLIIEAKRTYNFTVYPYDDMLLDMHYLQIELVQESSSIIILIEFFSGWYNRIFVHNANCGQLLDFSNTDGPLCSCSHRPYKCRNDEWSIEDAITYTFYEILDDTKIHDLHRCLAITKL
ncbi:unnamed protein product, partial [Rotaria magnacalcarata]